MKVIKQFKQNIDHRNKIPITKKQQKLTPLSSESVFDPSLHLGLRWQRNLC